MYDLRRIALKSLIVMSSFLIFISQESRAENPGDFTPLPNQKYALCAGAPAFNFDGITYAKCLKLKGDSLGQTHAYPPGALNQNIATVNKIGMIRNNFRVSTWSPPSQSFAVYTCKQPGAYAQCNGGLCSESTSGKPFPGVGPIKQNEIICSCRIVTTSEVYHVTGPSTCPTTASDYDAICGAGSAKDQSSDGVVIRIGSAGPAIDMDPLNDYYNKQFGTQYALNKCERPAN